MNTKKKSVARRYFKQLRKGPLTFGKMLESIRMADELTQTEVAKRIDVSRAHLCDIEKGRCPVTVERATQLAKALGYSVNQFVAVTLEDQLRNAGLKVKVKLEAA